MATPTITNIRKHQGIAGQFSYTASVTYPGEDTGNIEFVGDAYGTSVIMVMGNGAQVSVRRDDLWGVPLNPDYVRRFFEETS